MATNAINFRNTSGYVTDGTDQTYTTGEADTYPTTRGGITFGWVSTNGDMGRDRTTSGDVRLAGINQITNNGTQREFQVDVSSGDYDIGWALGDSSAQAYILCELLDDATSRFSVEKTSSIGANNYADANGSVHARADWPGSNTVQSGVSISSGEIHFKLGSTSAESNSSVIAHLYWNAAGGSISGSGAGTFPSLEGSGSGDSVSDISGSGSGDFPSLEGSGSGDAVSDISGSGSGDLPSLEGSGSGSVSGAGISGSGSGEFPSLEGSGSGDSVSDISGSGAGTFPSLEGSGSSSQNPFSGDTGERFVFPFLHTETIGERLSANSWTTWADQVNAGYPYLAQPTPATATFEEVIDLGTTLSGSIISVVYNKTTLDGSISDACTISYSSDGVSWTDVSGTSTFGTNFRYVKVNIVFTGADDSALAYIDGGISIRVFVKNVTDEGIVSADSGDSGGTPVTFNKDFLDVSSLVVSVNGNTTSLTAVRDFDDVPNPTGFEVYVYDKDGTRQSASVHWIARGSVDPGA